MRKLLALFLMTPGFLAFIYFIIVVILQVYDEKTSTPFAVFAAGSFFLGIKIWPK